MKYLIGDDLGIRQRMKRDLGKGGGGEPASTWDQSSSVSSLPLPSHDLALPVHGPRLLGGIEESRSQDDNFENG